VLQFYLRPALKIKDYYKILELPPSATLQEIKSAYRRLAHQYHPDKNNNDLYAAAQFDIIKEAYEVLSNPYKKEYYLQQRWYNQSIGKKRTETVITSVTVLKQVLEFDQYVSRLDVHRIDKEGLYDYICNLLSDETIEKLNTFFERDINKSITESILKSSRALPYHLSKSLAERLIKIRNESPVSALIQQYTGSSRRAYQWEKYKPFALFLIVLLVCTGIYFLSRKQ
jgi:curved DNA-binding protein CbpA